ncbi:MAG TPA: NlpC/P60 family protein [Terriglobales bacterium]
MRPALKLVVGPIVLCVVLCIAHGQETSQEPPVPHSTLQRYAKSHHSLSRNDRRLLLSTALDIQTEQSSRTDCSHLVHDIYEDAGFPYAYAPSSDIYQGIEGFQRVKSPQPGDLVVWRGHVGIVIKPSRHTFFSFLSSGPGTDDYQSAYWKHRGQARFYRYLKTSSR